MDKVDLMIENKALKARIKNLECELKESNKEKRALERKLKILDKEFLKETEELRALLAEYLPWKD